MGIKFHTPDASTYNIFDGDAFVEIIGWAAKDDSDETHVLHSMKMMLENSREATPAQHEYIYLGDLGRSNFRYAIAKTPVIKHRGKPKEYIIDGYKGNRVGREKPKHYQLLRNYLVEYHRAMIVECIETDDMLGIQATKPNRKATIHTHDKDLNMVECDIYNLNTRTLHTFDDTWVLELNDKGKLYGRGWPWFMAQMLMGDGGDNIPGIPGYGDKTTFRDLTKLYTRENYFLMTWGIYKEYYKSIYPSCQDWPMHTIVDCKERYLEIAQLLWMQVDDLRDIKTYLENNYAFD